MFTGIITDIGTVTSVEERAGERRFVIGTNFDLSDAAMGASIACDGCCLTVVEKTTNSFTVDVSAESLSKTTLGSWAEGTRINLERSLRLGDELGGHIVSGHVDAVARIKAIDPVGDSYRITIAVPDHLAHFIAPKGSVALNGISLTVNDVNGSEFQVNIIPHTWQVTNLSDKKTGDPINMEVDMLARYAARILGKEAA